MSASALFMCAPTPVDVAAVRKSMLLGGSIHSIHDDGADEFIVTPKLLRKRPLSSPTPSQQTPDDDDTDAKPLRRPSFLSKLIRFKLYIKKSKTESDGVERRVDAAWQPKPRKLDTENTNTTISPCPVCFENDKPTMTVGACDDRICAECMHDYVCTSIFQTNGAAASGEVECPMTNCKARITASEVQSLLNEPERQRFQWFRSLRQVDANPTLVWCPRPGCCTPVDKHAFRIATSLLLPSPESGCSQQAWFVRCSCCAITFCVTCRGSPQMHRDNAGDCTAIKAYLNETHVISNDVKHCPHCQVPIVRGVGCAQMFCWHCRHVFCWWCLANLTDDILLMHFEKGHCQGRLGHSRPNLLWHRFQAVALVTGAGLTMITLSPLMFVAVPIYVIAKHTRRMIRKERKRRRLSAELATVDTSRQVLSSSTVEESSSYIVQRLQR